MVRVFSTKEYDTWERILQKEYGDEMNDIVKQLKESWKVGRPLGYPFFREKKFGKYRAFFLVYEKLDAVLLVTISDKKAQQDTIDQIKDDLDKYKEIIRQKLSAL
ncbi:MAG: hypothetical protein QF486_06880 [Candidatus Woesearchaeota archaeon]|jgi:hypothetical protein|nr:hypothetical protein [Candidatus Woesearchaeota archaeon]MDP7182173.1 hypothetical protein [Candidatus Woesearchaeota archaeon]MDP7199310.1 hypothetical protein [Candidatus Woesearchaeota archaeon]MDP7467955.1 hypothetical protein [Candidatus Woesearchaeota archaeon]MDP7647579.1 hypothetical protein [Candidatus Woesearchaeota archaeon]|tara:strand:- start:977 stop:1291 length:315 start_codon:yes stop_codon:yes gene_type:complete